MADETNIVGTSIVLIGKFDPEIAQPGSLFEKRLFHESDAPRIKVELRLPDVISLTTDWINFSVEQNRIVASTTVQKPLSEPVRDFVLDIVSEMPDAMISAFGINNDFHFSVGPIENWHRIGDAIAPKKFWQGITKNPGLLSITMQSVRDDGNAGYMQTRVETSTRIPNGIYVQVNDHFASKIASGVAAGEMLDLLEREWGASMKRSEEISQAIRGLGA